MGVVMVISGGVMTALLQFSNTQATVYNRSTMHAGVRSATELLQQEVGQAGRVTLPGLGTIRTASAVNATGAGTVTVTSGLGIFVGEKLVIDTGDSEETVTVTAVGTDQFTANFRQMHAVDVPVIVLGGFASGVVPSTMANGSTGTVLKIYGDINGDGSMVYVEYTCDTVGGNLYRNVMPFTATSKPTLTVSNVLLDNVLANPGGTPCFTYQEKTVGSSTYVLDVAISLTTRTQFWDKVMRSYQTETKALLNVSPRNVFNAWLLASMGATTRVQPMPPSVTALLP